MKKKFPYFFFPVSILFLSVFSCDFSEGPVSGAVIVALGRDTILIEQFELKGNELKQSIITRSPRVQLVKSTALLDNKGNFESMEAFYYWPNLKGDHPYPIWPLPCRRLPMR